MKLFIFISLLLVPSLVAAQESAVAPSSECAAVLAAPPFVDILTRNDRNDFDELSPVTSGRALLGLECSVDELTEFFEGAGWEFLDYRTRRRPAGPLRSGGGRPDYYFDAWAEYCFKQPTLFGMFDYRCRPMASILFYKGRISNLLVHVSK